MSPTGSLDLKRRSKRAGWLWEGGCLHVQKAARQQVAGLSLKDGLIKGLLLFMVLDNIKC